MTRKRKPYKTYTKEAWSFYSDPKRSKRSRDFFEQEFEPNAPGAPYIKKPAFAG